ncbi:MAG: RNA polymerase sigma factor [Chiayiivirga sp.]|uniref:RNA polymerase sigma factor n=1 Tax=Lysobacteraceae TaxID=32033 RepID=UPI0025C1DA30|nr:RNA polymerase sigma factor [Chiayiivirga sp.]MCI1730498.1 RNA polymerase sigma factor [Chiayiivirga sp.]
MPALPPQDRFVAELERHKPILYKIASAYCARREDRGDLIQDIVIELWRAYERFDGRASFSTWMHRIAVNVAISFYRGESRRIRDALPIEDFALDLAAADRVMDAAGDDVLALRQLIAQLGVLRIQPARPARRNDDRRAVRRRDDSQYRHRRALPTLARTVCGACRSGAQLRGRTSGSRTRPPLPRASAGSSWDRG